MRKAHIAKSDQLRIVRDPRPFSNKNALNSFEIYCITKTNSTVDFFRYINYHI